VVLFDLEEDEQAVGRAGEEVGGGWGGKTEGRKRCSQRVPIFVLDGDTSFRVSYEL
jgi:hypothetical protein